MTDKEYNEKNILLHELIDAYEEWWNWSEEDGEKAEIAAFAKYQELLNKIIERMK